MTTPDWADEEAERVNYHSEDYYLDEKIAVSLRAAFLRGRVDALCFEIDDQLVENVAEYIMKRRCEFEPHDTPEWSVFITKPENADLVVKWRLQTRHGLEGMQKFLKERAAADKLESGS